MIPTRQPWTRQPQGAAQYRPGWSAQPLTGLLRGDLLATDGQPVVTVGTVGRAPGPGGLASTHASGATNMRRAQIRGSRLGTTGGASLLAVWRSLSGAGDQRIASLGSDNGASGNTIFSIGTGSGTIANLRVTIGGSGGNSAFDYSGTTVNDGQVHAAVITATLFDAVSSSQYSVHFDGRTLQARTTIGGPLGAASLYNWIVAAGFRRGGADSPGAACDVLLAVPFFGALSDDEARALTANPWQLFAPIERRIWVPSAGGGFSSTGALAATAATVAGTASHLTLHSATGSLVSASATLSGVATSPHLSTGALVAGAATIAGTANRLTAHTSTGALAAGAAVLSGAANVGTGFNAAGSLSAQAAAVVGAATRFAFHTSSGTLTSAAASLSGAATHTSAAGIYTYMWLRTA